jgi:hypothetical protein
MVDYYNVSDFVPIVFKNPLRGRKQWKTQLNSCNGSFLQTISIG